MPSKRNKIYLKKGWYNKSKTQNCTGKNYVSLKGKTLLSESWSKVFLFNIFLIFHQAPHSLVFLPADLSLHSLGIWARFLNASILTIRSALSLSQMPRPRNMTIRKRYVHYQEGECTLYLVSNMIWEKALFSFKDDVWCWQRQGYFSGEEELDKLLTSPSTP